MVWFSSNSPPLPDPDPRCFFPLSNFPSADPHLAPCLFCPLFLVLGVEPSLPTAEAGGSGQLVSMAPLNKVGLTLLAQVL